VLLRDEQQAPDHRGLFAVFLNRFAASVRSRTATWPAQARPNLLPDPLSDIP